jgi:hypothetical protein
MWTGASGSAGGAIIAAKTRGQLSIVIDLAVLAAVNSQTVQHRTRP